MNGDAQLDHAQPQSKSVDDDPLVQVQPRNLDNDESKEEVFDSNGKHEELAKMSVGKMNNDDGQAEQMKVDNDDSKNCTHAGVSDSNGNDDKLKKMKGAEDESLISQSVVSKEDDVVKDTDDTNKVVREGASKVVSVEKDGDSKDGEAEKKKPRKKMKKKRRKKKGPGSGQCAHCLRYPTDWIKYVASLCFVMYC
jgi:hypothetical protein